MNLTSGDGFADDVCGSGYGDGFGCGYGSGYNTGFGFEYDSGAGDASGFDNSDYESYSSDYGICGTIQGTGYG